MPYPVASWSSSENMFPAVNIDGVVALSSSFTAVGRGLCLFGVLLNGDELITGPL